MIFARPLTVFAALAVFPVLFMAQADTWMLFFTDVLYIPAIYHDLFILKNSFSGWALTPAPYFFPDMPLYAIARFLTGSMVGAVTLSGVVQFVLLYAGFVRLVALWQKELAGVSLAFLFVSVAVFYFQPFYTLYLLSMHSGVFLVFVWLTWFYYSQAGKFNKRQSILFFIVLSLSVFSDRLMILYIAALFFTEISDRFRFKNFAGSLFSVFRSKPGGIIVVFLYPVLTGLLLLGMLKSVMHVSLPAKIPTIISASVFTKTIVEFSVESPMVMAVIVFSFLYHLYMFAGKKDTGFRRKIHLLSILLFVLAASVPVATGVFMDKYSIRYLVGTLVFVTVLAISDISFSPVVQLTLAAMLVAAGIVKMDGLPNPERLYNRYPGKVSCLDNLAGDEGFRYGLSDYWNAKYISLFSRKNLWVDQINYTDLSPVNILNNRNWYMGKKYRFIVTEGLNRDEILKKYGQPLRIHDCGSEVFVYNPFEIPVKGLKF